MKKILIFSALVSLLTLGSCDKGFEQLNVNPTQPSNIDPIFLFANAIRTSGYPAGTTLIYDTPTVQQTQHLSVVGVLEGANLNRRNDNNTQALWNQYYPNPVKLLTDVIQRTKDDPARQNLYNMARIWRTYVFSVLTDEYGDIPYKEAGLGYINSTFLPKYDPQQEIYRDMLTQLEQASAALDATKRVETGDLLYAGDTQKWKRLGYSMMLRLGMRLTKADPATAEAAVKKAFAGSLMQANADNALLKHSLAYNHPNAGTLISSEKTNYYLHKTFVDYLKTRKDPRLSSIAVVYSNPSLSIGDPALKENTDPAAQIGMPMGYDDTDLPKLADFPGKAGSGYLYSQINRRTLGKIDATLFYVTNAQTQLLLAEAAQRGWVTGSVSDYFKAGVRSNLEQMADYDPAAAIPAASITAFMNGLTLRTGSAAQTLEDINTQYWVASFLNGPETVANWRRSGYPVLQPNPYPGKTIKGDFIRRLNYPTAESFANKENYLAAVARMGADDLDTRVWWDK